MTKLLVLLFASAIGCASNGGDDPNDPNDPNDPGDPLETCLGGNNCVCPGTADCGHACSQGAPECHVQGNAGPVDVVCNDNAECHVECSAAESCDVDCGGSAECNVTCPDGNCTVTNCGGDCVVSCGGNEATLNGTTATCP